MQSVYSSTEVRLRVIFAFHFIQIYAHIKIKELKNCKELFFWFISTIPQYLKQ